LAREEDVDAVLPWAGVPREAISARIGPYTYAGFVANEVVCLYGIRFFLIDAPQVWLLSTPALLQHRMAFLRANREFIHWARAEFGVIESLVKCNNNISRRWLEWLGFRAVANDGPLIRMSTYVE
jgi:hypothetical protein